jgi:hypothetical protein
MYFTSPVAITGDVKCITSTPNPSSSSAAKSSNPVTQTSKFSNLDFNFNIAIPEVKGVDDIKQIRPITLINVTFKFIAKAYTIRLAPLANRTLDRNQTAFIKGRCLHEGVLALHEIAHELRVKKLCRGLFLKLDSERAYDRVNWDFLREVLLRKGFSAVIVHRLMQLVSGDRRM